MAIPVKGDPEYSLYHGWQFMQSDATAPRMTYEAYKAQWCSKNPGKCAGGTLVPGAKVGSALTAVASTVTKQVTQPLTAAKAATQAAAVGQTWPDLVDKYAGGFARYLPWALALAAAGGGLWWWHNRGKKAVEQAVKTS